jgi:hypothetical protein
MNIVIRLKNRRSLLPLKNLLYLADKARNKRGKTKDGYNLKDLKDG